jgi:hypothetical protein
VAVISIIDVGGDKGRKLKPFTVETATELHFIGSLREGSRSR